MTALPERTELDIKVDDAYHRMVTAATDESRRLWGGRFTDLVNQRNAERTPEEIERIEREKGLRTP